MKTSISPAIVPGYFFCPKKKSQRKNGWLNERILRGSKNRIARFFVCVFIYFCGSDTIKSMSNKISDKTESAYLSLAPRRRDFVDAYLECKFNGTQAALKAGYSQKTAEDQAARLLGSVGVKAAINERRAEIEAENQLRAVEVVEELRKIGFSDITKILSWKKNVITVTDSAELPPGISACISEISEVPTKDGSIIKIKLHNKIAALEMLGRYLKMFADKEDIDKSKDIKSAVKDIASAILRDCQTVPEASQ